jgi:hypothetical protein
MSKTAICLWCGEAIGMVGFEWAHKVEDGPDRQFFCDCHCIDCDPEGGYTDERECIDGESAKPDLLTIKP